MARAQPTSCCGGQGGTASATIFLPIIAGPTGLAELDQVNEELGYFEPRPWHRDNPQRPKVWAKDPAASNLWGGLPSDDMMK